MPESLDLHPVGVDSTISEAFVLQSRTGRRIRVQKVTLPPTVSADVDARSSGDTYEEHVVLQLANLQVLPEPMQPSAIVVSIEIEGGESIDLSIPVVIDARGRLNEMRMSEKDG